MAAGLIAYRLCDREFDCERCPLDIALRRASAEPPGRAPAGDGRGASPTIGATRRAISGSGRSTAPRRVACVWVWTR